MSYELEARSLEQSCQEIINCVHASPLNYSVNLTPYSMYITIRKSFSKNKIQLKPEPVPYCERPVLQHEQQIESLHISLKKAEAENHSLKHKFEETLEDCENIYKENKLLSEKLSEYENETEATSSQAKMKDEILEQLKKENSELREVLVNNEKESKDLKRSLSEKDKQLYNLEKESKKETENFRVLKAKFDELTNTVNHDKKQQERKLKKKEKNDFINKLKGESETPHLKCEQCDVIVETVSMLKFHMRTIHMSNVEVQTDDKEIQEKKVQTDVKEFSSDKLVQTEDEKTGEFFVKYPCNYCGTNIANSYHLKEHIGKCHGTLNMYTEPGLPKPPFSSRLLPPPSQGLFSQRGSVAPLPSFYNPFYF